MKSNTMKNVFQHITVSKNEYQVMLQYTASEKLQYLINVFQNQFEFDSPDLLKPLDDFFDELASSMPLDMDDADDDDDAEIVDFDSDDSYDSKNRVDILIDNDNVLVESNSLKALRHIVYNFFDTGYILQRDSETEKMFRKDKLTRYLRVYRIVGVGTIICPN